MMQASGIVVLGCVGMANVKLVRSPFGHWSRGKVGYAPSAWDQDQEEILP